MLVRIFTTIKEIPEFRCASSAKGGRWWSETPSFLRMQESLHSFVVSKRTSIKKNTNCPAPNIQQDSQKKLIKSLFITRKRLFIAHLFKDDHPTSEFLIPPSPRSKPYYPLLRSLRIAWGIFSKFHCRIGGGSVASK